MRFLIDENMPRIVAATIERYGHQALDVRDIGLRSVPDRTIATHAREEQLCIITRDAGFGDVRSYPPADFPGLMVIDVPYTVSAAFINNLVEAFLKDEMLLEMLPGRLAIVQPHRVRFR